MFNVFVLLFNSTAVNPKYVLCSTRTINIDVSPSVAWTAVAVDRGLGSAVFLRTRSVRGLKLHLAHIK